MPWRAPQNHQYSSRNIDVSASGPGKLAFHQNCWSLCKYRDFSRNNKIYHGSLLLWWKPSFPGPDAKPSIFLKEYWWFGGVLDGKVAIFTKSWILRIGTRFHQHLRKLLNFHDLHGNVDFAANGTSKPSIFLREYWCFRVGSEGCSVFKKNWNFVKFPENQEKPRKWQKTRKSAKIAKNGKRDLAENGPPTRPRLGPPFSI